jgi:hypothetical protein
LDFETNPGAGAALRFYDLSNEPESEGVNRHIMFRYWLYRDENVQT